MTAETKFVSTYKAYIVFTIQVLITFGIGSLPPFAQITPTGMQILGIFLGCIFCWLFGYLGWSSIFGVLVLALWVPGQSLSGAITASFGNATLWMVVFTLVFSYALLKCGMLTFLANLILSRKFVTKSPLTLAIAFWIAAIFCTAFTNQLASTVLVYSIFYEVAKKLGIQPRSSYTGSMLVLLATYGALAVALFPFSSGIWLPVSIAQAAAPAGVDMSFNIFYLSAANCILMAIALIIGILVYKVMLDRNIVKVEFSMDSLDNVVNPEDLKITRELIAGFIAIGIFLVVMLGPIISPDSVIGNFLSKLGVTGAFMFACFFMAFFPKSDGSGTMIFNFEEGFPKGIQWGLFFMMMNAYNMAGLVASTDSGIMASIVGAVENIIPTYSEFLTIAMFCLVILIVTNCITNFIAMQLIIPIFVTILVGMGCRPMVYIGLLAVLVEHGNIMPSGSPVGALMHGNSAWLKSKQVYGYAALGSVFGLIGALCSIPILQLFYHLF